MIDKNINKILKIVEKALDLLYINEEELFKYDASERSIVFHFGRYFIKFLEDNKFDLNQYSVDCEYNRTNPNYIKKINNERDILPDLILHKRGDNKDNIMVIEFKKDSNNDSNGRKNDDEKLKYLTSNNGEYRYKMGLLIELKKDRNNVKIIKYINGNVQ